MKTTVEKKRFPALIIFIVWIMALAVLCLLSCVFSSAQDSHIKSPVTFFVMPDVKEYLISDAFGYKFRSAPKWEEFYFSKLSACQEFAFHLEIFLVEEVGEELKIEPWMMNFYELYFAEKEARIEDWMLPVDQVGWNIKNPTSLIIFSQITKKQQ